MKTWPCLAKFLLPAVLCLVVSACSRQAFRKRADKQAYQAIGQKGGHLDGGGVYPRADSRLYDPFSPDCPPMPPDDPRSHRLMQYVDGKRGYKHWDKFGCLSTIEPVQWLDALPRDEQGMVRLNLRDAVRVARTNSREFQRNIETLYLSALDVTFERFRFDYQLFAGNRFVQDFRGRDVGRASLTKFDSFVGFNKLSATGGELVAGLANSLVWDSWGTGSDLFTTTLDFTLVQPLLRFGGRARVLELLTQSERDLLANVRQMEQFRQGFYVEIVAGRNSGSGPLLGGNVGQLGLGLLAGTPSGRNGAPRAAGYLGLLQDQQEIRNQFTNIAALRDSLAQLEAAFDANRINSRLQVDQARQALLNAQSSLLSSRAAYQSRVDQFKIDLGLPPGLPLEIEDSLLDRFILIDPKLTLLQNELAGLLFEIRRGRDDPTRELVRASLEQLDRLDEQAEVHLAAAMADLNGLDELVPERKRQLRQVAQQIRESNSDVDPRVCDEERLLERIEFVSRRIPQIADDLKQSKDRRAKLAGSVAQTEPVDAWKEVNALATKLSDLLLELSLVHAEVRLQGIVLLPIEIQPQQAVAFARLNRLDWMNARANLVDVWRKIEFFANALKSDLDVIIDGQVANRPNGVLDFDTDRSRVRLAVEFDSPTARLAERNRYRAVLIDYQQARRNYMLFEDRVTQSLRNTLRIIELSQINLEVRRTAVQVAIAQVDVARLSLNPPVRPNQASRTSPTAARDLVSALSDLLDAQNDLLNVWVSYEALRILLDFEMGTMQLDPTGIWIDPGPLEQRDLAGIGNDQQDLMIADPPVLLNAPQDAGLIAEPLSAPGNDR